MSLLHILNFQVLILNPHFLIFKYIKVLSVLIYSVFNFDCSLLKSDFTSYESISYSIFSSFSINSKFYLFNFNDFHTVGDSYEFSLRSILVS